MKEQLPFIDRRISIGWFDKIGLGVTAIEKIEKGIFVEIAPVVVFDTKAVVTDQTAFKYVIAWGDRLAIPLGWTMIYNHSSANNCEFSTNIYDELLAITTVKDVQQGEQLTVNYGPHWFSSRGMEEIEL